MQDTEEWARQKAIVDDHNARGEHLSYWDHLPTDEWTPPFDSEIKEQAYIMDLNRVYENYLGPIHAFNRTVYPPEVRDVQTCAILIYWNMVMTLEAAFFLTRWLLPWGQMEWNNIKQTLAATWLLEPYAAHRGEDGTISCDSLQIPTLDLDQDFPITTSQGEGHDMEISYNPQVHGDPLIYPEAFMEVPGTKVQQLIHQMEPDQLRLWSWH